MIVINEVNNKTIVFYQKENRHIPLSSRFAPEKESRRVLEEASTSSTNLVILLGLGNFYLGLEIIKKYQNSPVVILEVEKSIIIEFNKWLKKYYSQFSLFKNIFFINQKNWEEEVKQVIFSFKDRKLMLFKNQKQMLIFEKPYAEIEKSVRAFYQQKNINRFTITKFENMWFRNLTKNTKSIIYSYPLKKLANWGKEKMAVVVGAGPSLYFDLAILQKKQKQVIIIAVDTIVKVLLHHKIYPDFIVAIDPQKINAKYLENLPNWVYQKTILIHEPGINAYPLRFFKKKIIFDSIFPFYNFLSQHFGGKGKIEVGGSVVTAALAIVEIINFKKTIFIGLDLCYTSSSYHLRGTMYEEYWFSSITRFNTHAMMTAKITNVKDEKKIFNRLGEVVFIDTKFELFKKWIEKKISTINHNFYNGSQTGIKVDNLPFKKLTDFLKTNFTTDKIIFIKELHNSFDDYQGALEKKNQESLKYFKEELTEIIIELKKNLTMLKSLLDKVNFNYSKQAATLSTFKLAPVIKPWVEVLLQNSLYELEKQENLSSEHIENFYKSLEKALAMNVKYLTRIKI